MVLQCYAWILSLFPQIVANGVDYFSLVPDEIIINILSRLPSTTVVRCRIVCKRWRILTSTSNFIELHQRRAAPLTVLNFGFGANTKIFVVDEKSKTEVEMRRIETYPKASFVSSCNGLFLLKYFSRLGRIWKYFVVNPISKELVTTLNFPGMQCGFFFHPLANEHRILFLCRTEDGPAYFVFHIGAKKLRRIASPNFKWLRPPHYTIALNGCVHWRIGYKVCVFDIIREKFSIKRLPNVGPVRGKYLLLDLVATEDCLCGYNFDYEKRKIDIWMLDDYENWSWIRKYKVNVAYILKEYPIETEAEYKLNGAEVAGIYRDELTLYCKGWGMFSYDLRCNTVQKINLKGYCSSDFYQVTSIKSLLAQS